MQGRQSADLAAPDPIGIEAAAGLQDAVLGAGDRLRRRAAEADDQVGIGELDLALDERPADRDLLRRRIAVPRRSPRHDVGDVRIRTVEADGRHHAVEELARAAHEGFADPVLVGPRRLADEHQLRRRIAVGEDEVLGGELQRAAVEAGEQRLQFLQGLDVLRARSGIAGGFAGLGRGRLSEGPGRWRRRTARGQFGAEGVVEGGTGTLGGCLSGAGRLGAARAGSGESVSAKRSWGASSRNRSSPASTWKSRFAIRSRCRSSPWLMRLMWRLSELWTTGHATSRTTFCPARHRQHGSSPAESRLRAQVGLRSQVGMG